MDSGALWLTERDVTSVLDMGQAIDALDEGLRLQASGAAANMVKTHARWEGGATLHAIGAAFPGAGYVGTKTWAHASGAATPVLVLFDSRSGALAAVIEAFALGQLRTGAMSGIATRHLASPGADELAVAGTGKQALSQVAAAVAVRPVRRVHVYSRRRERAAAFAVEVERAFGVDGVAHDTVEAAVADASIITLVTRATTAFLPAGAPRPGAHVNAIGAIVPSRAEFEPALLARAGLVVVDDVAQTRELSSELSSYYGTEPAAWSSVRRLADVVDQGIARPQEADVTVFKAMGIGIADLALGIRCLRHALGEGVGRPIPRAARVAPRLGAEPARTATAQPNGS